MILVRWELKSLHRPMIRLRRWMLELLLEQAADAGITRAVIPIGSPTGNTIGDSNPPRGNRQYNRQYDRQFNCNTMVFTLYYIYRSFYIIFAKGIAPNRPQGIYDQHPCNVNICSNISSCLTIRYILEHVMFIFSIVHIKLTTSQIDAFYDKVWLCAIGLALVYYVGEWTRKSYLWYGNISEQYL